MSEAPKSEINDVQPSSLRHIVGQDGVKSGALLTMYRS